MIKETEPEQDGDNLHPAGNLLLLPSHLSHLKEFHISILQKANRNKERKHYHSMLFRMSPAHKTW
jgi:hypothetical protein